MQSIIPWTAWCRRPLSASSWRPSAITPSSSHKTSAGSGSSKGRPSGSLWRPKASAVSWASSWSPRCLQGSFRIGSWGRLGPKVAFLGFHTRVCRKRVGAAVTLIPSGECYHSMLSPHGHTDITSVMVTVNIRFAYLLTGLFEQRVEQYLEELPDTEQSGVNKFLKGLGEFCCSHTGQGPEGRSAQLTKQQLKLCFQETKWSSSTKRTEGESSRQPWCLHDTALWGFSYLSFVNMYILFLRRPWDFSVWVCLPVWDGDAV